MDRGPAVADVAVQGETLLLFTRFAGPSHFCALANPPKLRRLPVIQDSLKDFDLLPDSAHVRLPTITALFACSPATVWRGVRDGRIPKPAKIHQRAACWNVGALRAALAKAVRNDR